MKPETEYIARQLAGLVIADRGERGHMDDAGAGIVEVHLRGISHEIRQQILVDYVSLAKRIADEIERQTAPVNLEALVRERVKVEIERAEDGLEDAVRKAVDTAFKYAVEHQIEGAMKLAAGELTRDVAKRLHAVAFPPPRKRRGKRP